MNGIPDSGFDTDRISELVREIIPFRFLSFSDRAALVAHLTPLTIAAGGVVYAAGDLEASMYILAEGLVETVDDSRKPEQRINRIEAGHYFGERAALFDIPREYTLRAVSDSVVYTLSAERFLELVHTSRAFAQSLGAILREKQGIFDAFDRFTAELTRGVAVGTVDLRRLLPLYRVLDPALHPGANGAELDFSALKYALSRLPENVTRNFIYLLTDDLPFEFSSPNETFTVIPSAARRRNVWEMLPGKSMVLLRSGVSDLLDFVTCLCLYAVEAGKIRERIVEGLEGSPFSSTENSALEEFWAGEVPERLEQIARHREVVYIDIRRQTQTYNSRRTDLWTQQISAATRELLGCDPAELPEDLAVHVVSSNTHSVTNCLNPFYATHAGEILEWAKTTSHSAATHQWANSVDLVYAVARDYVHAFPRRGKEEQQDASWGMLRLRETASTGIEVQLVDLSRLAGVALDPDLGVIPPVKALLVNIDYAFGEQAEEIIRNLIMLFGRRLASINVLGKAGALVGERGEILVPTAFVEQSEERYYPVDEKVRCNLPGLVRRAGNRKVRTGPLLTVSGTLLQNSRMLHFYRHIWDCIGLEMEGTYYYRQILESQQIGIIDRDIPLRFLYYVSDLPLERSSDLSAHLGPDEGVPPLYAITRQILSEILTGKRRR